MDVYDARRGALHVAVNGPMESHGSSSRQMADDAIAFIDAHKDRKFFLWLHFYDPHLSYEPHPEVPRFGASRVDLYDGEIRFTDLHVGRVLARLKELACGGARPSCSRAITARASASTASPSTASTSTRRRPACRSSCACPGCPRGRAKVPAGHIDIAPTLVNLARGKQEPSFIGARSCPSSPANGRPTSDPWVFQEVRRSAARSARS
jgi:arylsulfatase A-like enzyme